MDYKKEYLRMKKKYVELKKKYNTKQFGGTSFNKQLESIAENDIVNNYSDNNIKKNFQNLNNIFSKINLERETEEINF